MNAPKAPSRLPLSAALMTLANGAGMMAGAVFAILVAAQFGSTATTDGFFAAVAVYSTTVLTAQSWRTTIVARLVEADSPFELFNRYCGTALLVFAASGIAFVALGSPLASVLTGDLPPAAQSTARASLLILWPAVGGQLFVGLASAMLAVFDDYIRPALTTTVGSIVTIGAFLALEPALGGKAMAAAVLLGTCVTTLGLAVALVRSGWRPTSAIALKVRRNAREAPVLLLSSVSFFLTQVLYVVSISFAARLGEGVPTLYSYAFAAHGIVKGLVSMSLPLVLAAPIAITWDRNPATLRPLVDDSVRITLVLLLPAAAAAALIGDDIGELIFPAFTSQDVDHIVGAFLILAIAILVSQLSTVPTAALFTLGRYWAVALLALPITAIHFGLSLGASAIGTLAALAAATTVSYSCRSIGVLTLVHKRGSWEVAGRFARALLSILLPAVACFGLPALLFRDLTGALADPLAFACGLALYAGTVATLPAYRKLGLRLLRALRRSPASEGVAAD